MVIKFERRTDTAKFPTKVDPKAVGWDVYADTVKVEGGCLVVDTGISIEPPEGYWFGFYPRSSQSKYEWVFGNSVGVIEPEYRGHLIAKMRPVGSIYETEHETFNNFSYSSNLPFKQGDRIGQIVLHKLYNAELLETKLSDTERGTNGFGSTGK